MYSSVNTIWVLVARRCLFDAGGFAMSRGRLHPGQEHRQHPHENLMDFCIGTPVYWLLGFG